MGKERVLGAEMFLTLKIKLPYEMRVIGVELRRRIQKVLHAAFVGDGKNLCAHLYACPEADADADDSVCGVLSCCSGRFL